MSRSYKKTPYCGDHKGKSKKRMANKAVRSWLKQNPEELLKGSAYQKIYETYDVCDYYWIRDWEEYWKDCLRWHAVQSLRGWGAYAGDLDKEFEYRWWKKHYKNK